MSRILIVDDERWIREGIKAKLKRLGYEKGDILEAANGKEALSEMKRSAADIVLTDIRMDEMDGLKLCEELGGSFPGVQKVIICGYSEFDYAAKAIELGVAGYLLKPIDISELEKILVLCKNRIEAMERQKQSEKISELEKIYITGRQYERLLSDPQTLGNVLKDYQEGDTFVSFYFYMGENILLSPWKLLQLMEESAEGYTCGQNLLLINPSVSECMLLYLLKADKAGIHDRLIEELRSSLAFAMEENGLWDFSCGISQEEPLPLTAIRRACEQMHFRVLFPEDHFLEKSRTSSAKELYEMSETDRLSLRYAVRRKDFLLYSETLQKIQKEIQDSSISYGSLCAIYGSIRLLAGRAEEQEGMGIDKGRMLPEEVWRFHSCKEMFAVLKDWGMSRMNLSGSCGQDGKEQMVIQLREYIDRYYYEDITLDQFAKNNYVSLSWLSMAFHDLIGKNFQEYLNEVRLSSAKRLLSEKKYKIGTVAEMVGFSDQHYFSRVFKKNEGCTPKEYMEKNPHI